MVHHDRLKAFLLWQPQLTDPPPEPTSPTENGPESLDGGGDLRPAAGLGGAVRRTGGCPASAVREKPKAARLLCGPVLSPYSISLNSPNTYELVWHILMLSCLCLSRIGFRINLNIRLLDKFYFPSRFDLGRE